MAIELDELRQSVQVLQACQARIKQLKEVMTEHRALIEEKMGSDEIGTVDGETVITWKTYKQRRLDQSLLGISHPDVLELCKVPVETRRMEIL